MSVLPKVLFALTGNDRYLVEDTYNGLQPDDPEQDVDQIPEPLIDVEAANGES